MSEGEDDMGTNERGRAATHIDPKEDAILAAWQALPAWYWRNPWMAFRAGYLKMEACAVAAEQRVAELERERDRSRQAGGFGADEPDSCNCGIAIDAHEKMMNLARAALAASVSKEETQDGE
jgi:hypothetical protein